MEIWDVYDIDRQLTGKRMDRGAEFEDDAYTCVMHICIFNSKGEMLIQQRQSFKRTWPNLWDLSIGGHTEAGETSRVSAERELFEELGLKRDLSETRAHFTINFVHGFDDYYFLEEGSVEAKSMVPYDTYIWIDKSYTGDFENSRIYIDFDTLS